MKQEITNTEQAIMQAAENEFIEKGYAGSKTTQIAKAAGVTHAMLHYYFRTKENLFNQVFQVKSQLIAASFSSIVENDLPFFEKIKIGVETHFDIIAQNPRLPIFILNEILANKERKDTCQKIFQPTIRETIAKLRTSIEKEAAKGTIRFIDPVDLILTIVSLNVFTFIAEPVIKLATQESHESYQKFIQHRKQENVETILSRLKI